MGDSLIHKISEKSGQGRRPSNWNKVVSEARIALQHFRYEEALKYCETALAAAHLRPDSTATILCLKAEALESLARFNDAIQALSIYEQEQNREALAPSLQSQVCWRLGSAYGGTAELPKAIAYAKQSLALATRQNEFGAIARSHVLLGTLYRRLGELRFARDHFSHVINDMLRHGDHQLLAQAYNGQGVVCFLAGEFDQARQLFKQGKEALQQLDDPLISGSLDVNLATIDVLQGKIRESVTLFEEAIPQLERVRNPRLVVNAHSNLGYSLLRLGEMQRADETLQHALIQARACEASLIAASTLETMGELRYLQGEFVAGELLLAESLANLRGLRVSFNEAMALLTQGRGLLLAGKAEQAAAAFRASLEINERMGDPRGEASARLCLIEAHLALKQLPEAQGLLTAVSEQVEQLAMMSLVGHLREVSGSVALASGHENDALRCFNQAASIWESIGDRYRAAVVRYYLGQTHAQLGNPALAQKILMATRSVLQELGTLPMLARTEELLYSLPLEAVASAPPANQLSQVISVMNRLLEAEFSRAVLLHEVLQILSEEFKISPVIIFQETVDGNLTPLAFRGCNELEALELGKFVAIQVINPNEAQVCRLSNDSGKMLWLYLGKRRSTMPDSLLDLIIKQLRLGLERCERQPDGVHMPLPESPAHHLHPVSLPGLIYRSAAMKKVVEQVISLHSSDITVLVTGETGTGKELVARAIHAFSKQAAHPFIPFNCASAPRELIESQLFGHRRGSFTGATVDFPGMIGAAEKGTLFLDEIGELAREMQPKLLRFLQNGEVQRLGETAPRLSAVRVIAATNRNLEEMVTAHEFRADLYYRLNVIQFHLPALRERREEIPLLTEHFLARYLTQSEKKEITLTPETSYLLKQYDWPGNARQLENEIQRLVALAPAGEKITEEYLSPQIRHQARIRLISSTIPSSHTTLANAVAETERQVISAALARHNGNITRAADELGASRYGLRKMLQRHKIVPRRKVS